MVLCLAAHETADCIRLLYRCIGHFKTVCLDIGLDHPETYNGCLSADVEHLAHTCLSLDFHDAALLDRFRLRFYRFRSIGSSLRLVLLVLLALLLFAEFLHLLGNLVLLVLLVDVVYLSLEIRQFLTGQSGLFLLGLCFLNGTDRIFNLGIRFLQQMFGILFRLFQDRLAVLFQFHHFGFVLGDDVFHLLFPLADVLALGFPVTLVAYDVLQILVGIDVFATHDFGCIGDDFLRQTDLTGDFHGK